MSFQYSFWSLLILCFAVTLTQSQLTSPDADLTQNGVATTGIGNAYDDYEEVDGDLEEETETKKIPGKRTSSLSFVKELKNVTKEAGDFLKLKCDVIGSIPATSIQVRWTHSWRGFELLMNDGMDAYRRFKYALWCLKMSNKLEPWSHA